MSDARKNGHWLTIGGLVAWTLLVAGVSGSHVSQGARLDNHDTQLEKVDEMAKSIHRIEVMMAKHWGVEAGD